MSYQNYSDILNKHILELSHNSIPFPKVNLKILGKDQYPEKILIDIDNLIYKYKNQIDLVNNHKIWDYCKKLTNDFEMIHISNKNIQLTNIGLANYDPISRSYFKMWEMIKDFNLIDNSNKSITVFCLAEGPGGFVEAICNIRKHYCNTSDDSINCMTLKSYKSDIPGWKKSMRIFKENPNIDIYYGNDGSGDLYKTENLIHLEKKMNNNKCDLVTADGGFDFSIDYNKQEELSYRLIICQIVAGISILKLNGHFVLKVFDNITKFSLKIIYFLTTMFLTVNLVKPFTSRPANSEKYIVCKNFLGINKSNLDELYSIIDDWEILSSQNKNVEDIFEFNLPINFILSIKEYNMFILNRQLKNILKTLTYIRINLSNSDINYIKQNQAIIASLWCLKYGISINYRCKFLKDNIEHYNYIPNFINY